VGRTVTLRGEAAGEFIRAQTGRVPQDDDERALRIATLVHMNMVSENTRTAIALIKAVARDGLEAAAAICTAKDKGRKAGVTQSPHRP
jgi:hypothetical protein